MQDADTGPDCLGSRGDTVPSGLDKASFSLAGNDKGGVSLSSIANILAKSHLDDDDCQDNEAEEEDDDDEVEEKSDARDQEEAVVDLGRLSHQQAEESNREKLKKATCLASLANNYAVNEDFKSALKYYSEAIYLNSTDFRFYCNRSFCYEKTGDYEKALKDAEEAIRLSAGHRPKVFFRKGRALLGLKRFEESEAAFNTVLKLGAECETTKSELVLLRYTALRETGFDEEMAVLGARRCQTTSEACDFLTNIELMALKSGEKVKESFAETVKNAASRGEECLPLHQLLVANNNSSSAGSSSSNNNRQFNQAQTHVQQEHEPSHQQQQRQQHYHHQKQSYNNQQQPGQNYHQQATRNNYSRPQQQNQQNRYQQQQHHQQNNKQQQQLHSGNSNDNRRQPPQRRQQTAAHQQQEPTRQPKNAWHRNRSNSKSSSKSSTSISSLDDFSRLERRAKPSVAQPMAWNRQQQDFKAGQRPQLATNGQSHHLRAQQSQQFDNTNDIHHHQQQHNGRGGGNGSNYARPQNYNRKVHQQGNNTINRNNNLNSANNGHSSLGGAFFGHQPYRSSNSSSNNSNWRPSFDLSDGPTNLFGYKGIWLGDMSPSASPAIIHSVFGKFGKVASVKMNKEGSAFIAFDNPTSPRRAIGKFFEQFIPGLSDGQRSLKFRFVPTQDQEELNFARPSQPKNNNSECYFWRTTGCNSKEKCKLKHIQVCQGIDFQPWMRTLAKADEQQQQQQQQQQQHRDE